jgi:hypothetical protein
MARREICHRPEIADQAHAGRRSMQMRIDLCTHRYSIDACRDDSSFSMESIQDGAWVIWAVTHERLDSSGIPTRTARKPDRQ